MKFEVGKKYKNREVKGARVWTCLFVTPSGQGILVDPINGSELLHTPMNYMKEYIEPRKGTVFVNVYPSNCQSHGTRSLAEAYATKDRLAYIEIPWVEGQGLDICKGNCCALGGQPCGKTGCKE